MFDEEVFIEPTPENAEQPDFSFATIASVSSTGVTLILDGQDSSGGKEYKCNACAVFQVGDRVKVHKDSGTLVVEFPLGAPGSRSLPASSLQYSGSVGVDIDSSGNIKSINTSQPSLGTSAKCFKNIYTKNGNLSFNASKLGFFGADPIAKQSIANNATVATLITALKNYGLFT